jgi:esterase
MVTTGYLERDILVGNLKIHYQEWGESSAPTILMLHGFGVSGHMFDEFAERMRDRYRLIAVDQRGHGDSDWSSEGDYSRNAFVHDIEGLRAGLGLERFILIGHSMGGLNAVSYTTSHPNRVRALVLVDVGPESAKEGVDNIVRFTRGPDELPFEDFVEMAHRFNPRRSLENIQERMRHRLKPTESGKWTWKFDRRFRQQDSGLQIGSQLSNDEMWQLYRDVSVPTLLIRGAESDVLTQEVAERAAREMQRARLVVVPGAGHSVPGDNPDDFTAAVRDFIADLETGRFEPVAASEPPALEQLLQADQEARRGPGLMTLVLIGVGAAAALSGTAFLIKKRADNRRKQKSRRARVTRAGDRIADRVAHSGLAKRVDIDQAQHRAADLSRELTRLSRRGIRQARTAVEDVELDRAREAAMDVLHVLGERTRMAPAVVREAVENVDRKKLKKRGKKMAKQGRSISGDGLAALSELRHLQAIPVTIAALIAAVSRGSATKKKKAVKQQRLLPWQN